MRELCEVLKKLITMKITVTGSLGYISTPLIQKLVEKGHSVTVISSKVERQKDIEILGAAAAIGVMEDVDFLIRTFKGADAVYCMLAPYGDFADPNNSANAVLARADAVANNYFEAIAKSGVKRVIYLSSIGAHTNEGNGLIRVHYNAEHTLNKLPADVAISFMRPAGFYKNLLAFIPTIKNQGVIAARYGGNDTNVFVSNLDIADAIMDELESPAAGRRVRYVASEEPTCQEAAAILGAAIGKPDLEWVSINDEQQLNGYQAFGMNESLALQFVEMNASIHTGKFYEDYYLHKPALGKVRLSEFAKKFATAYHQQ